MSKCIIETKSKEEIENALYDSVSFADFLKKLGHKFSSNTRVCKETKNKVIEVCKSYNLDLSKFNRNCDKRRFCVVCNKKLTYDNKTGYCRDCLSQKRINDWLKNGKINIQPTSAFTASFRSYILKEQNEKCAICGLPNFWNGKVLKFVLDHIDGDASNNSRNNVRLVCPNCDSQLDTFKSKNKNSARNFRHKYY